LELFLEAGLCSGSVSIHDTGAIVIIFEVAEVPVGGKSGPLLDQTTFIFNYDKYKKLHIRIVARTSQALATEINEDLEQYCATAPTFLMELSGYMDSVCSLSSPK